jgi:hypothetical protein
MKLPLIHYTEAHPQAQYPGFSPSSLGTGFRAGTALDLPGFRPIDVVSWYPVGIIGCRGSDRGCAVGPGIRWFSFL